MLEYPHFVLLATDLTSADALKLEEALQAACFAQKTSRLYRKYHPDTRGKPHRKSTGGSSRYDGKDYSVYLAWR